VNHAQYADLERRPVDPYADAKYRILLRQVAGRPPLRVLDVGCGAGDFCARLAAAGHDVTGLDAEPRHVELARERQRAQGGPPCRFEVGTIEAYRADEPFDCVLAVDVLEHIEDDRAAFRGLVGSLRPGGLVLVTVPAGPWLFGSHDERLGHVRRYTRASLRRCAETACRVEWIRHFGASLVPVALLYSRILRRDYPVAEVGDPARRGLAGAALRALLAVEERRAAPVGTSLILRGVRP
jgi:SAM-dependent methyltransferase